MDKPKTHFEQIPTAVVKKIAKLDVEENLDEKVVVDPPKKRGSEIVDIASHRKSQACNA